MGKMFKILNGNSLEVLKTLEAESVDCVMTSPPYLSLRNYGGHEQTWDGDSNCAHEWGPETTQRPRGGRCGRTAQVRNTLHGVSMIISKGCSCTKCNAWRGHLGLEPHYSLYIQHLIQIFDEVKRVLKKSGTCWVNLGDTFGTSSGTGSRKGTKQTAGSVFWENTGKPAVKGYQKSLCNIPSRFTIAMTDRGWILRNEIIWHKPNGMPAPCNDRFTVDFEKIFFFTKSRKYYFEQQVEPVKQCSLERNKYAWNSKQRTKDFRETRGIDNRKAGKLFNPAGRNMRCVWTIPTQPYSGDHFAVYPEALCERPIKAGCPPGGIVLDPFCGHGTTGRVAVRLGRKFIGIDVVPENCEAAKERIALPLFSQESA